MTFFTIRDGTRVRAMTDVFIRSPMGKIQKVFLDGDGTVRQLLWEGRSLGCWPDYTAADCYRTYKDAENADASATRHLLPNL